MFFAWCVTRRKKSKFQKKKFVSEKTYFTQEIDLAQKMTIRIGNPKILNQVRFPPKMSVGGAQWFITRL